MLDMAALTTDLDALCAPFDRADAPGCALGVAQAGRLLYARGLGLADLEHGVPITQRTVFHVASVSKQFAACATLLLAADGAIGLDDDVRAYVPEVPDYDTPITVRQVMHHTSGLRDQWNLLRLANWRDDDLITNRDVLWIVARQRGLNFPPGTQWLYSNTGYTLLSIIIERVSGLTLRQFAQQRIFAPLGMTHSHFRDDHAEVVPNRAHAYAARPDGSYRISMPVYDVVGATSLHTTLEDLARWADNFQHRRVGSDAIIEQLLTPGMLTGGRTIQYAGGLQVHARDERGLQLVEHSGGDFGFRAHFVLAPEQGLAVICLANLASFDPASLAHSVLERCLAPSSAPTQTSTPPSAPDAMQFDLLAGLYRSRRTGAVRRVSVVDGALHLGLLGMAPLVALGERRFAFAGDPSTTVAFTSDDPPLLAISQFNDGGEAELHDPFAPVPSTPDELSDYGGVYSSDELATSYTLAVDNGALELRHAKLDGVPLEVISRDLLAGHSPRVYSPLQLDILRDVDGRVRGFTLTTQRLRGMVFTQASG